MIEKIYFCDPNKNKKCGKNCCYLHGKWCAITRHKKFAREGDIPHEQAMIVLNDLIDKFFKLEDDLK